jgi:hypothetical protein
VSPSSSTSRFGWFVLAASGLVASACLASTSAKTASVDAGADATPDSGGQACTALVCDDFESYAAGGPPGGVWSTTQNGGSVTIDTTRARSGKQSVKITAAASTGFRSVMIALQGQSLLPVAGNVVYGRMMFWLDSAPQTSVHWTFIDGQGLVPGQTYHAVYRYGGQLPIDSDVTFVGSELLANYDTPDSYDTPAIGPSSDCWLHSNARVVPVGAWTCAEWSFDGPNNTMHFWMNGVADTDLTMDGTGQGCVNQPSTYAWLAPSFARIDLGWESYQADDARDFWIDDVAIGTRRIGCPSQ